MAKEQKPWFRDRLGEDVKKRLGSEISALNDQQRSRAMTLFYLRDVLSKTMPGIVPDDEQELEAGLVDGAKDGGVDFIYRADGRVLVVQAKYHKRDKGEEIGEFIRFCEVIKRLHSIATRKTTPINSRLAEIINDIDWESDYFYLHFITLGKLGTEFTDRAEQGIPAVESLPDLEERSELQLLDEGELNERLREALSAGEMLDKEIAIKLRPTEDEIPWITFTSGGRKMLIGEISGSQVAELYSQHRYRLFSMNIRDYVGETATNKAIMTSALKSPHNFVFFNNGISAIANSIREDEENCTIYCRYLSIINGAQTVRTLRKSQRKDSFSALKDVRILFRVIEVSPFKEQEFLADVTKFNNTQNSIKISDFRSNDTVQKDLGRRFNQLVRGGKKYWYKNKRSRENHPQTIPVNAEEFAKTIHAFCFGPDDAFGGTKYLFDVDPKEGYRKVFGDPNTILSEPNFRLLAGTFFCCEVIREKWEELRSTQEPLDPALERRWMVYFAVAELLKVAYGGDQTEMDSDLRRLGKPQWLDDPQVGTRGSIQELTEIGCTVLSHSYNTAQKNADFKHRNWFRDGASLREISLAVQRVPIFRGKNNPLPKLR